jgi:hypothetical protein
MDTAALPDLLTELHQHFQLIPNHDRALDGRIVDTRFDPDTGQLRDVSDIELVGRIVGPPFGGTFFQTWYFTVEGIDFQFNQAFDRWGYHGIRYRTECKDCAMERWRPISKPPARQRCPACRDAKSTTPLCPETGLRCSTAYVKHKCRCADCRAWHAASHRQRRARRNSDSSQEQLQENDGSDSYSPVIALRTIRVPTPLMWGAEPAQDWTWLPVALQHVLVQYETARQQVAA